MTTVLVLVLALVLVLSRVIFALLIMMIRISLPRVPENTGLIPCRNPVPILALALALVLTSTITSTTCTAIIDENDLTSTRARQYGSASLQY